jgi:integrase
MKKTLTDAGVKALQPGATLYDTQVPGLHVRADGRAKNFSLFFVAPDGTRRRLKLGAVGIISIVEARDIARKHLNTVAHGKDPVAERVKLRAEPTVQEFWDSEAWPKHFKRKKDARNYQRIFNARVAPRFGHTKVRDVDYADVSGLHADLEATPVEANRTLALVSKMLNLAERPTNGGRDGFRDSGSNPCGLVARYPELKRKRFAKLDELARIGREMDARWVDATARLTDKSSPNRYKGAAQTLQSITFIALSIFTGMRPIEIAQAKREWIDRMPDGSGILRLPDSKTGQRDVYLSTHALATIDKLPAPRNGTLTGIKEPRTTWGYIRTAAGCPDLRLYDLRRTFATVSLAGGQSMSLIGEVLGHRTVQTTKIYARLMDEPAAALVAATGDRMATLLGVQS